MKRGELNIYYRNEINPELDQALGKVLKKFGYTLFVSGMDIISGVRDLSFDKPVRGRRNSE